MNDSIAVVGGGLSGSLLAVLLAKRGFNVSVYERRPDMRFKQIPAGKSINLALSVRGLRGLEKAGLADDVMQDAIPMYGRCIHFPDGTTSFQPYGKENQAIYSVSRGRLNTRLLELAGEFPTISMHFDHKCVGVSLEENTLTFETSDGSLVQAHANRIIGTDGAFASTRARLQTTDRFNYEQSYLPVGYKELCIPPVNGQFMLDKNCLHIWPRGAFMMIALPNPDGTFTCTLFLAFEGEISFEALKTDGEILQFFETYFPDAIPLMPTLLEDFNSNPIGSLVTVRCFPWVNKGRLALMGDAAHAVVPFFGQGMNCSFEDAVVLDQCLESYLPNWEVAFERYQDLRKPNADAISRLAIQNFTEMAEKVGDQAFLHRKKVEHDLCDLYPEHFQSQYELVTFTTLPYTDAWNRGAINDAILNEIIDSGLDKTLEDASKILPILERHLSKKN